MQFHYSVVNENGIRHSFRNTPGYYAITVSYEDCCSEKTKLIGTFYVRVLGNIPPVINLKIYDNTNPGGQGLVVSHNISSANIVGASSMGFYVNGSTGNIANANVLVQAVR